MRALTKILLLTTMQLLPSFPRLLRKTARVELLPVYFSRHVRALVLCVSCTLILCSGASRLFVPVAGASPHEKSTAGEAVPFQIEGFHDGADCNKIFGWAWDSATPNLALSVDIYDGSTKIATVLANQFRSDLASKGNGLHAFNFTTPASLKDGRTHSITVKFGNTQFNLSDTPRSLGPCTSTSVPP